MLNVTQTAKNVIYKKDKGKKYQVAGYNFNQPVKNKNKN